MFKKFLSRKLLVTVLGAVLTPILANIGMSPDLVERLVMFLAAYILGQSAVDAAATWKGKKTE